MRSRSQQGFTALEILLIVIAVGLIGALLYLAGLWRVDVEAVEFTSVPTIINYGGSGQATVAITFDRQAPEALTSSLQIWESDGWEDDPLLDTRFTLFQGKNSVTNAISLTCDTNGYLNGDDDENDRVYEIYAYVVDSNGGTESSTTHTVTCAPLE